ncbi:MAG: FKBP-type peptidyl-prolyl cis-trans isomerase [Candidatus Syntrophoarchaeum sp. GoM_oil]|nr:MAG: FKBP-type peptidyl-prolyl cis-trans isomerase [Candidatus Syntrophoarchaeum sp. GoM_oil]
MKRIYPVAIILVLSIILVSGCMDKGVGISPGDTVSVNYIGSLDDGTVFDTSYEDVAKENDIYTPGRPYEPLSFEVGAGQMIKGFDDGVIGMKVGETKTVVIPPEDAYGERNPEMATVLPRVLEIPLVETFNKTLEMPLQEFNMNFGEGHEVGERLLIPESEIYVKVDELSNTTATISYDLEEGDTFSISTWNETVVGSDEDEVTVQHELSVGDEVTLPQQPWISIVTEVSATNATLRAEEIIEPEIQTPFGTASVSMNETNITIDYNHRLAGETLTFEITVVSINSSINR